MRLKPSCLKSYRWCARECLALLQQAVQPCLALHGSPADASDLSCDHEKVVVHFAFHRHTGMRLVGEPRCSRLLLRLIERLVRTPALRSGRTAKRNQSKHANPWHSPVRAARTLLSGSNAFA